MKSHKSESLEVGKGGLPPLFLKSSSIENSGGKPPFPTCEFMTIETYTVRHSQAKPYRTGGRQSRKTKPCSAIFLLAILTFLPLSLVSCARQSKNIATQSE